MPAHATAESAPCNVNSGETSRAGGVLRINLVDSPQSILRLASLLARRRFEVVAMDVSRPADGQRQVLLEVACDGPNNVEQLVKFLNNSPDVIKVVALADRFRDVRRTTIIRLAAEPEQLGNVAAIAYRLSAEMLVGQPTPGCIVLLSTNSVSLAAAVNAFRKHTILEAFTAHPLPQS